MVVSHVFADIVGGDQLVLSKKVEYYLGGDSKPVDVTEDFGCSDRIYVTYKSEPATKEHVERDIVQFNWFSPGGKLEFVHKDEVVIGPNNRGYQLSNWLEFKNTNSGQLLGGFLFGDGGEKFIGKWRVTVNLKDETLVSRSFSVIC